MNLMKSWAKRYLKQNDCCRQPQEYNPMPQEYNPMPQEYNPMPQEYNPMPQGYDRMRRQYNLMRLKYNAMPQEYNRMRRQATSRYTNLAGLIKSIYKKETSAEPSCECFYDVTFTLPKPKPLCYIIQPSSAGDNTQAMKLSDRETIAMTNNCGCGEIKLFKQHLDSLDEDNIQDITQLRKYKKKQKKEGNERFKTSKKNAQLIYKKYKEHEKQRAKKDKENYEKSLKEEKNKVEMAKLKLKREKEVGNAKLKWNQKKNKQRLKRLKQRLEQRCEDMKLRDPHDRREDSDSDTIQLEDPMNIPNNLNTIEEEPKCAGLLECIDWNTRKQKMTLPVMQCKVGGSRRPFTARSVR